MNSGNRKEEDTSILFTVVSDLFHFRKTVPPKLDKSNIRLVVYAETDRGRTPYFDSNAITCIEEIDKVSITFNFTTITCIEKIEENKHNFDSNVYTSH